MHGGGRLEKSSRLSGIQSDLKAVAVAAVALLRHRMARRKRPQPQPLPTRRLARPEPERGIIAVLEKYTPRRIGVVATALILLGSAGLGIVKGGHVDEFVHGLDDARNAVANIAGFRIEQVAISGRKQLTQDEILAIGGVTGRSSLLFLDAAAVRDKLKANPWIADATVLKFYPSELQIDIVERTAFARWQLDGRTSVIAEDGAVLEPYVARRFLSLPLVVGKGAGERAKDFLALLARYPQVQSQTRAVALVGERRWNVWLSSGLVIRLPEQDVGNSLAMLTKLDQDDKLFSRDITAIDMRLPDRLTVRLSDNAAKAREEQFSKDKKSKKKAGDA
ncbi:cell division protein FtsQ/DivIB [Rhodopseudomonas palustris]|uniref:cell division protein FtsQ/DivIB n=1 Tax=Rhodopseudomonas palustris TaxID=1076 RepID=UPI002ACEEE5E|nr:cell division protein FtsQ/DivIB [Rhodopseudomonas palustris]WQH01513.1 cell division protein FtsQ/DivIB [Rhodopseudomonas palustris]